MKMMKMMKPLICFSLILLPLLATVAVVEGALLGGWKPIKDVSDPNVVKVAKFAITEHNKQSKPSLVYDRVVEGKQQVVSGIKYDLIISVKNGGGKTYEAIVWDKPWKNEMILESFKAV